MGPNHRENWGRGDWNKTPLRESYREENYPRTLRACPSTYVSQQLCVEQKRLAGNTILCPHKDACPELLWGPLSGQHVPLVSLAAIWWVYRHPVQVLAMQKPPSKGSKTAVTWSLWFQGPC